MSLQREYVELCQQVRQSLSNDEYRTLESVGITLFDVQPHMRLDELTGAHILEAVVERVQERGVQSAYEVLRPFYDTVCDHYAIENGLVRKAKEKAQREKEKEEMLREERRKKGTASEASQAPSPAAGAGPSAARRSAQRDTGLAS